MKICYLKPKIKVNAFVETLIECDELKYYLQTADQFGFKGNRFIEIKLTQEQKSSLGYDNYYIENLKGISEPVFIFMKSDENVFVGTKMELSKHLLPLIVSNDFYVVGKILISSFFCIHSKTGYFIDISNADFYKKGINVEIDAENYILTRKNCEPNGLERMKEAYNNCFSLCLISDNLEITDFLVQKDESILFFSENVQINEFLTYLKYLDKNMLHSSKDILRKKLLDENYYLDILRDTNNHYDQHILEHIFTGIIDLIPHADVFNDRSSVEMAHDFENSIGMNQSIDDANKGADFLDLDDKQVQKLKDLKIRFQYAQA